MAATQKELQQVDDEEPKPGSELTSQIVDELRQKPYNKLAAYLAAHDVIQRPFEPASYLSGDETVEATWNLDRPERAMALAVYIFEEGKQEKPNCKKCSKSIGPLPAPVCFVPSSDVLGGACTNCAYSGRRLGCSFVQEEEARRVEKERGKKPKIQSLTSVLLQHMSFSELEELQRLLRDALERRRNSGG
ncbi:uncharacterized protein B0H64DRAFT_114774 [Chaetomium fimeti]|uniref:Uncharacterized protein n=1 Tax=Chaetomium fimeti TaxID=1854472 RepID=A0AAE0HJX0_9PEZI|nr:hypothetical protein B0H64DRAFT_114774 [Chaetomium fimeti]